MDRIVWRKVETKGNAEREHTAKSSRKVARKQLAACVNARKRQPQVTRRRWRKRRRHARHEVLLRAACTRAWARERAVHNSRLPRSTQAVNWLLFTSATEQIHELTELAWWLPCSEKRYRSVRGGVTVGIEPVSQPERGV